MIAAAIIRFVVPGSGRPPDRGSPPGCRPENPPAPRRRPPFPACTTSIRSPAARSRAQRPDNRHYAFSRAALRRTPRW